MGSSDNLTDDRNHPFFAKKEICTYAVKVRKISFHARGGLLSLLPPHSQGPPYKWCAFVSLRELSEVPVLSSRSYSEAEELAQHLAHALPAAAYSLGAQDG